MAVIIIGAVPPPYNGMTVYTQMLLDGLREVGTELVWVDNSDHRDLSNIGRLDLENVHVALKTAARLVRASVHPGANILHLPIAQARLPFVRDGVLILLGRLLGLKVVIHMHGSSFDVFYQNQKRLMRWLVRRTLRVCVLVIVLTPRLRGQFDGLVPPDRVVTLSNAVPEVLSESQVIRKHREARRGPIRIGFLGALFPSKGALDLVEAISRLGLKPLAAARFTLAGNQSEQYGLENRMMRQRVEQLAGMGIEISIAGPVSGEHKAAFFSHIDVLVLPSYDEGQPLVVLEAFSAGCAVVCTDVGGLPETVTDGRNAIMVRPGAVDDLADAMWRLIVDPEFTVQMGVTARDTWQELYQPTVHAKKMASLLIAHGA